MLFRKFIETSDQKHSKCFCFNQQTRNQQKVSQNKLTNRSGKMSINKLIKNNYSKINNTAPNNTFHVNNSLLNQTRSRQLQFKTENSDTTIFTHNNLLLNTNLQENQDYQVPKIKYPLTKTIQIFKKDKQQNNFSNKPFSLKFTNLQNNIRRPHITFHLENKRHVKIGYEKNILSNQHRNQMSINKKIIKINQKTIVNKNIKKIEESISLKQNKPKTATTAEPTQKLESSFLLKELKNPNDYPSQCEILSHSKQLLEGNNHVSKCQNQYNNICLKNRVQTVQSQIAQQENSEISIICSKFQKKKQRNGNGQKFHIFQIL